MAAQIIPGVPQFTRPELHGPSALGFDELVDFHLKHNPDHPFARLSPRTRKDRVLTVTWRELSEAVHRAGHALQASFGSFDAASPPVVGLLIPDDGIPYITIQLALIRIGLIPLLIPHKTSTAAVSHLISTTSCSYIVTTESHIAHIAQSDHHDALGQQVAALRLLSESQGIRMIPQPSINVLFPRLASSEYTFVPDSKLQLLPPVTPRPRWSTVMVLSSGPTESPEPIHLSWTAAQEWLCAPGDASVHLSGMTVSSMAWPKFEAGGLMACLVPTIAAGMIAGLFYPALMGETASQITSETVYDACLATGATFLYLPPVIITAFSKSPQGCKLLQSAELVLIGDGPLATEIGDAIVEQGVALASSWGSAEVGYASDWPPRAQGPDWQWLMPRPTLDFHFEPFHEKSYKIVIKSCATHHPSISRASVQDEPTEWQSDKICVHHPIRPGQFRIIGGSDNQLIHSNAEMATSYKYSPDSSAITVLDGRFTSSEVHTEEKRSTSEEETFVEQDNGPPVDRGPQAWAYVIAALILETVVWGYVQSYGVFLNYYTSRTSFGSEASASTLLPLVGTINLGTMFCLSPLVAGLCNGYPRTKVPSMYGGLLLMAAAMIGASFSKTSAQLIWTQGFALGVGEVLVYYTALSYLPEWFSARRGLANGIIFAGSGAGGCIFPFVIQALLDRWGFETTHRCLAVGIVVLIGPSIPFIRPRLPIVKGSPQPPIQFETIFGDRAALKSKVFWVFLGPTLLLELSFTLVTIYIPSYVQARSVSASSQAGSAVLAIINGASVISNCAFGALSDRYTPHLLGACISFSSCLFVLGLWGGAGAASYGALITFGLMFGLTAGSWAALLYSVIRECSYNVASTVMLQGIISFSRGISNVIAAPISSKMLKLHFNASERIGFGISHDAFSGLILFCGLCLAASGFIEVGLMTVRLRNPPIKRVD